LGIDSLAQLHSNFDVEELGLVEPEPVDGFVYFVGPLAGEPLVFAVFAGLEPSNPSEAHLFSKNKVGVKVDQIASHFSVAAVAVLAGASAAGYGVFCCRKNDKCYFVRFFSDRNLDN